MNEDPGAKQSWVSEGNLEKMLETFSEFPSWVTSTFKYVPPPSFVLSPLLMTIRHSADLGLWQLRDLVSIPISRALKTHFTDNVKGSPQDMAPWPRHSDW